MGEGKIIMPNVPPPPPGFVMQPGAVPPPPPGFQLVQPTIDTKRGAPASVRAVVGSVPDQDRLANLRRYYPDAAASGEDNFTFIDPTTGRQTLYNPPGLDVGDVASVGREAAQMIGAAGGGIAGAAGAAPSGFLAAPVAVPVGAALGSQGAGELYDRIMNYFNDTVDTRSLGQRMSDVGSGVLLESTLGKLGSEIGPTVSKLVSGFKNRFTGSTGQQIANDFRQIGANPSAGTMSGSRAVQTIENAVSSTAGGAGVIQRSDEALLDDLGKEAERVALQFGPTQTKEGVGAAIKQASQAAIGRFTDRSDELYDLASQKIPKDLRAVPDNTINLFMQMRNSQIASDLPKTAKAVINPKVSGLLESFVEDVSRQGGDGQVSYRAIKSLRSRVGKILGDPVGYPDFDRAQMKALYGSLSQDLDSIAQGAGGDAYRAHKVANRYFRQNIGQNIEFLEDVISKQTDEQAYNFVFGGIKDGGSKLRTLRRNVRPQEWDQVAGSTLWKMGQATPGQQGASGNLFSPATFLTSWNAMSPEAKMTLFGGTRYATLRPALDRLVRVSSAVKDTAATRNTSNTTRSLAVLGLLGASGTLATGDVQGGAAAIAGGILAPRATAKLLTNRKFVDWLANTASRPANYNGWGASMGRLVAIAKAEPEIREEIYQYVSAMREPGQ